MSLAPGSGHHGGTAGQAEAGEERALEEAAEWRVALEGADAHTQAAFEHWLQAHPEHRKAWQAIDATWSSFSQAAQPGSRMALEQAFDEERRTRRRLLGATGVALALILALLPLAWMAGGPVSPVHLLADHYTAVGERKTLVLPDGSELVLNTATAVDIDYRRDRRIIRLYDGEIHITVASDRDRPLDVLTPEGRARALGTRFSVRRLEQAGATRTRVIVQESRVELCLPQGESCLRLGRDQQAAAGPDGLSAAQPVDATAQAAWVRGQLVVDDWPLFRVLQALGRHHRGLLLVDEAELAGLRVSGVLPLDDIDRALNALAASQPIRIHRYTPWVTRVDAF